MRYAHDDKSWECWLDNDFPHSTLRATQIRRPTAWLSLTPMFGTIKWASFSSGDRVRLLCSILGLAGLAPFLACLFRHTCIGGHLAHGPYTIWPYANDAVWVLLLPAVAVVCWWSNLYCKQVFSLALLFLLATNVELMAGILPWLKIHVGAIRISLLAAVGIPCVGLFIGKRAGRLVAPECENGRTRRVMLVGIGVVACVMCFAFGLFSAERQRELAEQRHRRGRLAILLSTYKAVESTNLAHARFEVGNELLGATRDYQERFGIEKGTNRFARLFSEALAIADGFERETTNAALTNVSTAVDGQLVDPTTGLPLHPNERE